MPHNQCNDINNTVLEIIGIEVEPKHAEHVIIICWYRPPTSDSDDTSFNALNEIISTLDSEDKGIFLMGPTNCDVKKWKYGPTKKLKAIYSEFQLEQKIKNYIRIASKTNDKGVIEMTRVSLITLQQVARTI